MFGKPLTPEEKAAREAEITADESTRLAAEAARREKIAVARAAAEAKAASVTPALKTIVANRRTLEIGKLYALRNCTFQVYDPATLTHKQVDAVHSMLRDLGIITVIGERIPAKDFYPFIDVLFQFMRHEIVEGTFTAITGIELNLSTFNGMSDHNL